MERAKRIPVVMRSKITLKVAHAVDSEDTSYSEASLGRADWECKPEEDSRSAESGSDASSGNECSASSKDAITSSSSSSASSSSSS